MIITFISDTHNRHHLLNDYLIQGDIIIHSGDFSEIGDLYSLGKFLNWFNKLNYKHKIFIAGNHDFCLQNKSIESNLLINNFPNINYLQDNSILINIDNHNIKIYGSPWSPFFYDWAFNLYKNEIEEKWNLIPDDTDILITHTPPFGVLDFHNNNLGCESLIKKINVIQPKITCFGHIHPSYGYRSFNNMHFFNAASLNNNYTKINKPITIDWNPENNTIRDFF